MTGGNVTPEGELIVPIRVLDTDGHVHRFEGIVDTGFTGDLTLPSDHIRELGLVMDRQVEALVVNEEAFRFNSFRGTVLWGGDQRPVRILEAEGTPLIGTALLWGSLLTAEVIDNGAVTIGPLPAGISG